MERRMTIVLCCTSLATTGLLLICSIVAQPEPLEVDPGDVEQVEVGTLVAVEGRVDAAGVKDLGPAAAFTLVGDDGGSARVFAGFPVRDIGPGDRVRLTGTVALYKGEREVVLGSSGDLVLLARDPRPRVALGDVVANPWAYVGVEPCVEVVVMAPPVASANGNGSWCLVSDAPSGATAAMLVPRCCEPGEWAVGTRLEVACLVRYDAARGVVWLEPVDWRTV